MHYQTKKTKKTPGPTEAQVQAQKELEAERARVKALIDHALRFKDAQEELASWVTRFVRDKPIFENYVEYFKVHANLSMQTCHRHGLGLHQLLCQRHDP